MTTDSTHAYSPDRRVNEDTRSTECRGPQLVPIQSEGRVLKHRLLK